MQLEAGERTGSVALEPPLPLREQRLLFADRLPRERLPGLDRIVLDEEVAEIGVELPLTRRQIRDVGRILALPLAYHLAVRSERPCLEALDFARAAPVD